MQAGIGKKEDTNGRREDSAEPMKKPRTDLVELTFLVPALRKAEAAKAISKLGGREVADSLPWRAAFAGIGYEPTPGRALAGARAKDGITQKQLSALTGIP